MELSPIRHFLIVHDSCLGVMKEDVRVFDDPVEALAAYRETEIRHEGDTTIHVVLLGADSIETLKVTHGNYWDNDPWNPEVFAAVLRTGRP